jgi:DNA-binding transcriptional MerR regulator
MHTGTFDIQKLVTESGVPRRTIYFYVQQGLLPPPQGAGLAAYYTDEHLLRLQLIPVLRSQGLRLDEIRLRFSTMPLEEMRRALQTHKDHQVKERAAREEVYALRPLPQPAPEFIARPIILSLEPALSAGDEPAPTGVGWLEKRLVQYTFPGGITLTAPQALEGESRQLFEQLLQAARQIFTTHPPDTGNLSSTGESEYA